VHTVTLSPDDEMYASFTHLIEDFSLYLDGQATSVQSLKSAKKFVSVIFGGPCVIKPLPLPV
jgi:hypothetical protein